MAREGITVDRKPVTSVRPIGDRPVDEPSGEPAPWRFDGQAAATKSYKRRLALGAALVGAAAAVGAILYLRSPPPVSHPQPPLSKVTVSEPQRAVPPAPVQAAPPPKPVQTAERALRLPDHPHEVLAQSARGHTAVAVAAPKPHPEAAARTAFARPAPAAPQGDPDSGYTGFPLQPVEPLPPGMSSWTIPPLYAPAPTTAPKGANTLKPPAPRALPEPKLAAKPPVVAPPRVALMQPPVASSKIVAVQLPAPQPVAPRPAAPHLAAPPPVVAARAKPVPQPPVATVTVPGADSLPSGTPLHLQIIYTPAGPQEAVRVASLAARLRAEVDAIATSVSTVAPVKTEVVAYFFPDDRAGATAVAASLARLTKRPEPVKLLHMTPLPRPGTVEILLPLKSGKDLTNESS